MVTQIYTVTSHSLLHSLIKIPEYVQVAQQRGVKALGIMDENRLSATIDFFHACKASNIKPILGMDYVYSASEKTYRLQLIAQNETGFKNLMMLSTNVQTQEDFSFKEALALIKEDVTVIAGAESEFYDLAQNNFEGLKNWLEQMSHLTSFYVGVDEETSSFVLDVARQLKLPLFAIRQTRYMEKEDHFAYEIANCIQMQTVPILEKVEKIGNQHYMDESYFEELLREKGLEEAISNTEKVVDAATFEFQFHQALYPKYPLPENKTSTEYLRQLVFERLKERVTAVDETYEKRLEVELSVIEEMGFSDYFLIVWDVLKYAREEDIFLGAGRGSAVGSLVAYVLEITNVDPIRYQLLFERFLNKARFNPPDIDIDIPDNKRAQILEYVVQKYGKDKVAHIATFGTLAAKQVLQDVSRVFGMGVSEQRRFSKAVPSVTHISLEEALATSRDLRTIYEQSERNQRIFEVAKKLEGLPRNVSTHASGVIICDQELSQITPLQVGRNETLLTQMEQRPIEEIGLLKMDFLGLKNLKYIQETLHSIEYQHGQIPDLVNVDLTDAATLDLFKRGDTVGIFQFESRGMRQALKTVQPTSFEDVIAMQALFRPGPQENIPSFAKRKAGKEKITYIDDRLEGILKNTYGIIVYQEQIMQIAQVYAGYSLGEADLLRRAISKKKKEDLDSGRVEFVKRSVAQGADEKVALHIYQMIEKFANYGFNKSHAVAYSFVGFQMAYLKAHYPTEFFQTLLHYQSDKVKIYSADAKRFGVTLLNPDLNHSNYGFKVEQGAKLRFGLSNIHGVRKDFVEYLLHERHENGHFLNMDNFLGRIDSKYLKMEQFEPLVYSGALDCFDKNRKKTLETIKQKVENIQLFGGSLDIFQQYGVKEIEIEDFTDDELRTLEEQTLGVNLGKHPTEQYKLFNLVQKNQQISDFEIGKPISATLFVTGIRTIRTKKMETMAFVELEDFTGDISAVFFPQAYRQASRVLEVGEVLYVKGRVDTRRDSDEIQLIVDVVEPVASAKQKYVPEVMFIQTSADEQDKFLKLKEMLTNTKHELPVFAVRKEDKKTILLEKEYWLDFQKENLAEVETIFGKENIAFKE